jgi:hypothetical protein
MPWKPSSLLSPLKRVTTIPRAEERAGIATASRSARRENWHREVKKCHDILEYLSAGHPVIRPQRWESVRRLTADYFTTCEPNIVRPSTESDQILAALIDEHARNEPSTKEIAILTCLLDLSVPTATKYLSSLIDLDVERYLRCITLAGQINPGVMSGEEFRSAQALLLVVSGEGQSLEKFGKLMEALLSNGPAVYLPLLTIQSALARSGVRSRLQKQLDSYLQEQKFMSAFDEVSWLQSVTEISNNHDVLALLDAYFPSWPWLAVWRPNIDRINQWEHGVFTESQREKLLHAFELDGPDVATYQRSSLQMAEPECYKYVEVEPQSPEILERFLDLLYKAHFLGPGTLELFMYLCIDNHANEANLSTVNAAIQTGDHSYCGNLLGLFRAPSPQSDMSHQIRELTEALPIFNDGRISENVRLPMETLVDKLYHIMRTAQEIFCEQLRTGTGEYIGILIHGLGAAILRASGIHSSLPSDFLDQIGQFPPKDILVIIFRQLQDNGESPSPQDSRFRSYLASALGGRGGTEPGLMTLAALQEEIQFWKDSPDTLRIDLAKKIGEIRNIDYSLYTSCLLVMLNEHDLYITEMRSIITPGDEQTCLRFSAYLARRRGLNQLQNECWLLLLVSLLKEQGSSFLPRMADSISFVEWHKLVDHLERLIAPVRSKLPHSGTGLTRERLSWWRTLSRNMNAVQFFLEMQRNQGNLTWLYFPSSPEQIMELLSVANQGHNMMPVHHRIVSYLAPNGSNIACVCDCVRRITNTSVLGRAVCERIFSRTETAPWFETMLSIVVEAWRRNTSLTQEDKSTLEAIRRLLNIRSTPNLRTTTTQSASEPLQSEYDVLLQEARKLEALRLRLQHQNPQKISTLLNRVGVENAMRGRAVDTRIPDELVDAVEPVGENEYELSFALTGLSGLQRQARGISKASRMLLVRLCFQGSPRFCIHFSPDDEGRGRHTYWRPVDNHEPASKSCTTKPNLFTYYLGCNLHHLLRKAQSSMQSIYNSILSLVTAPPTTCLVCPGSFNTKLWKPATCSRDCTFKLQTAPLEIRLHNLLVDPLSIDLLLTGVYAAAADKSNLKLLPGCPIPKYKLRAVIDSCPPLANLQAANNLQTAIRGHDGYGTDRENLLSWLCLKFRGFLLSAQSSFRVPSMPNTQQFLMLNSNHEREKLFNSQSAWASGGSGRVVFHGTQVSRLFLILTEGLKVMSNTRFMTTGAVNGPGVYCGDDQSTSLYHSGSTGQSWRHSALSNMNIMLGCELAKPGPSSLGTVHVVTDQNSLLVRYVFLLPANYQAPPRRHVEPAMNITYANLHSGRLT